MTPEARKVYPLVKPKMWLSLLFLVFLAVPIALMTAFEVEQVPLLITWLACTVLASIGPIDFMVKYLHRRRILKPAVAAYGNLIFRIETSAEFAKKFVVDPLVKGIEGNVRTSLVRRTPKKLRKDITEPVFITLKKPGSVFSRKPDGSYAPAAGFCRGNWIEVEATDFAKTFSLVRHELSHYLLHLHFPEMKTPSQHKIMSSAGIP